MRDEHQVAFAGVLADERAQLTNLPFAIIGPPEKVAKRLVSLGFPEREARRLEAAAPGAREHPLDRNAAPAPFLADALRVRAAFVAQVALGAAVLEPHARWIACARRRHGVADQDHLAAGLEPRPQLLARGCVACKE